jgi:hypothetical protein
VTGYSPDRVLSLPNAGILQIVIHVSGAAIESLTCLVMGTFSGLLRKRLKVAINPCLVVKFEMRTVTPPVSICFHDAVLRRVTDSP